MAGEADINVGGKHMKLITETNYPWDGRVSIRVKECGNKKASVMIRIPNWARGEVTPGGLYSFIDKQEEGWSIAVNGKKLYPETWEKGYFRVINVRKGDVITLQLDMKPRMVMALKMTVVVLLLNVVHSFIAPKAQTTLVQIRIKSMSTRRLLSSLQKTIQ